MSSVRPATSAAHRTDLPRVYFAAMVLLYHRPRRMIAESGTPAQADSSGRHGCKQGCFQPCRPDRSDLDRCQWRRGGSVEKVICGDMTPGNRSRIDVRILEKTGDEKCPRGNAQPNPESTEGVGIGV